MNFDIKKRFLTNKKMLSKFQQNPSPLKQENSQPFLLKFKPVKSSLNSLNIQEESSQTGLLKIPLYEGKIIKLIIPKEKKLETVSLNFGEGKDLDWYSVSNKDCPETDCEKCKLKSSFHPNYINAKLTGCIGISCEKIEDVAKRLLEFRGYTYIKIDKTQYEPIVHYKCPQKHSRTVSYRKLRLGDGCFECKKEERDNEKKGKKPDNVRKEIIPCDCKVKKLGVQKGASYVCAHYNFAVLYPDLASDWDFENNDGIAPDKVSPGSAKKFWFICRNENCLNSYEQPIKKKTNRNDGCPYCKGLKVNSTNSFLSTHPELCKELDPDNEIKPDELTSRSSIVLGWICNKHETPYKYSASPSSRTNFFKPTGCRRCNFPGFEQEAGGHEFFLKEAEKAHPFENYSYPQEYINNTTPINIYCHNTYQGILPLEEHGLFLQSPEVHKSGSGCPKCAKEKKESKISRDMKSFLNLMGLENGKDYILEKTFEDMKYINSLYIDFYFNQNNKLKFPTVFETDGRQHIASISTWGGKENLKNNQLRDLAKDLYCLKNKINIIRIPYSVILTKEYIENLFKLCENEQVYMSYPHYIEKIQESFDLSTVKVIPVIPPLKVKLIC